MDEILKELNYIYDAVSSIPVTHQSVDTMAVVRAKLRKIYAALESLPQNAVQKEENADGNRV